MIDTNSATRDVKLLGDDGTRSVSLSDTLVVPDAAMSLMYVPTFFKKEIGVLFKPGYDIFFDILY